MITKRQKKVNAIKLLLLFALLLSPLLALSTDSYVHLRPQFLTNLQGSKKYLYTEVSLLIVDDTTTEKIVNTHLPLIRSSLVDLFSRQSLKNLSMKSGINGLQNEAVKLINKLLQEHGETVEVKRVLFTKFNIS
ncbi:flagellar basal body-associated FliL family protein [Piscirickettsia litoralis]|uniref:Flagellar protein FliL n=1 Tax=Piscirickettsia litoralis TaxID=1891921 RepID=A0ABX2ZZ89_9GAMM|nr:flagellar basal body-associated FliL family protein [Piscirickettsia litoralis]ODN41332.1 flagellar basal body-associated FliL family protein [Piscirickettsia litoralis]